MPGQSGLFIILRLDTGKRVDSCFTRPSKKDPLAPSPAWRRVNEPWVTPRTIGAVSFIGPFIVAGQRPLLDGTTEWGRDFRFMLPLYYFYSAWLSSNSLACRILLRPIPLLSAVFLLFIPIHSLFRRPLDHSILLSHSFDSGGNLDGCLTFILILPC